MNRTICESFTIIVKVAIAGGTGNFAREIVDVLAATKKHEILVLTRKEPSESDKIPGVTLVKADYTNRAQLIEILKGVQNVLSFIGSNGADPGSVSQKALIDTSIAAGVKRFAPNEWSSARIEELPWYADKGIIREYLKEINKTKRYIPPTSQPKLQFLRQNSPRQVIEYSLFQPDLIVDFLGPEGAATSHIKHFELWVDFTKRRAIAIKGKDGTGTFTTMKDLTHIVALAISYPGPWPIIGGVQGATDTFSKLLEIGEKITGGLDITYLEEEDVRKGEIKSAWIPRIGQPGLSEEQIEQLSKFFLKGFSLSVLVGEWVVNDAWNRALPEYTFEDPFEFLEKHWAGKR